jgi:hypothetical protein
MGEAFLVGLRGMRIHWRRGGTTEKAAKEWGRGVCKKRIFDYWRRGFGGNRPSTAAAGIEWNGALKEGLLTRSQNSRLDDSSSSSPSSLGMEQIGGIKGGRERDGFHRRII